MAGLADTLRHKRLLIVTGKGGVGKTTVTVALGLAAAELGLRTIVAELSGQSRVAHILARRAAGMKAIELSPRLKSISIDPHAALREYLHLQLGPLGTALMASRTLEYLTAATPGLSELVSIGKVWELVHGRRRPRKAGDTYDLVLVDGPSSGQCLALLSSPATFAEIARVGPVASQARAIASMLVTAQETGTLITTLAEELSVSETLMLCEQLEHHLGMAVDGVFVNRMYPRRFNDEDARALARALDVTPDLLGRTALRAALSEHARREGQDEQLARLSTVKSRHLTLEVPQLPGRALDRAALARLGKQLLEAEQ